MLVRPLFLCIAAALLPLPAGAQPQPDLAGRFGARPAVEDVSISPDGARLAFQAPASGQGSVLHRVELAEGAAPTPSSPSMERPSGWAAATG